MLALLKIANRSPVFDFHKAFSFLILILNDNLPFTFYDTIFYILCQLSYLPIFHIRFYMLCHHPPFPLLSSFLLY